MAKKKKAQNLAATVETDAATQSTETASRPGPKTKVESRAPEAQSAPTLVICRNKCPHCYPVCCRRADLVVDIGATYRHTMARG